MPPRLAAPAAEDARQRLDDLFVRRVRDLLAHRYGYAPRDAALPHLGQAVLRRRGAQGSEAYWLRLEASTQPEDELHQLLEDTLNHETSLGRTPPHFHALRTHVLPALASAPDHRVRLASLGCSTGEEAYSLAATTLACQPPLSAEVVGLDISRRALATARQGLYPEFAARELDDATRRLLLEPCPLGQAIRPAVSARVRFAPHNLMEPLPLVAVDVIFCRNVLIYFSPENTRRVLAHIRDSLRPGGWLFLGHSESAFAHRDWFEPVSLPETLAYRRR